MVERRRSVTKKEERMMNRGRKIVIIQLRNQADGMDSRGHQLRP